jgi:hypothetical protein
MGSRLFLLVALLSLAFFSNAESMIPSPISFDFSAAALAPLTWGEASPLLAHGGFDALVGAECSTPFSVPIRLEAGYIGVERSRYSSSGELYRAWDGARFAFLSGYSFAPLRLGPDSTLGISLLAGGALTAAEYSDTALAYAYPSVVFEPRAVYGLGKSLGDSGPYLDLPIELMFRGGDYSLSFGLGLGWRYRIMAVRY